MPFRPAIGPVLWISLDLDLRVDVVHAKTNESYLYISEGLVLLAELSTHSTY